MSGTPDGLMEAALEAARRAGEMALKYFGRSIPVELKPDGSPVTEADRAAEQVARDWIAARFPADDILGEESGGLRDDAPRRWLIDPIDGTRSFVRGVPLWGSLVALVEGDRVLAGAACFPALGERIAAAPGRGCWWNGARCGVSGVSELARATVLATDERFATRASHREGWLRLAETAAVSRTWGDCYGYLLVATGRAEVMVDPVLSPWDAAPLVPIIEEAGGVFTDWDGGRGFGSAIATNAALAAAARRHLGCPAPGGAPS
jgi:histidinol phosphatase-like enzyme (inositol monophosphatase family)